MPDAATIEDRVANCIDGHGLLDGVRKLGLAVSGGSDSIALLHLMVPICASRGISVFVLNFDHGVPGEHSDEDAVFVRGIADSLGVPFVGGKASGITGGGGESFEMAARKARHAFFREKASELGLDAIATGHQADDVAETLLLRLIRGSGAEGLSGMKPCSTGANGDLRLIRPLIGVGREELREWLRGRGCGWRDDPSNSNTAIQRNGIRRIVIPELERIAGRGIVASIAQSAGILGEEDRFLDGTAREALDAVCDGDALPVRRLCDTHHVAICRRVVRLWLMDLFGAEAAGFRWVEAVLGMGEGMSITFPGGARIAMLQGVARPVCDEACAVVPSATIVGIEGSVSWGAYTIFTSQADAVDRSAQTMGSWPASCTISLASLGGMPLIVRGRRPGDRIAPLGLDGTKSLQDVFVDAKMPASLRDSYPVLECGDKIVWVPGYRLSRHFAVHEGDAIVSIRVELTRPPELLAANGYTKDK